MGTTVRLAGYLTVLAVAFAAAWAIGAAAGPVVPASAAASAGAHEHGGHEHGGGAVSDGLAATEGGYSFAPLTSSLTPGEPGEYAFSITGSDGAPVTAFDVEHDERMHLVTVRRDGTGFAHVHPDLGPDGVWRTSLTLPAGGVYRVYADFVPAGGPPLTLGTDLFAPGEFAPVQAPASRMWEVDGYRVQLDGELVPGAPSRVVTSISRAGGPVTDLEPYLGAFGHLVALRQSDLSYLHVHPDGREPAPRDRSGPAVPFTADVPTAGTYRLFLDFKHGGTVRTAEFTVPTREMPQPRR